MFFSEGFHLALINIYLGNQAVNVRDAEKKGNLIPHLQGTQLREFCIDLIFKLQNNLTFSYSLINIIIKTLVCLLLLCVVDKCFIKERETKSSNQKSQADVKCI